MKKNIIITESQYKRIFLTEQFTTKDGTFYGAHNVKDYQKVVQNGQTFKPDATNSYWDPNTKSYDMRRPSLNLLDKPLTGYEKAQFQWAMNSAPNPKTGHNLISQEVLDNARIKGDLVVAQMKYNEKLEKLNKNISKGDDPTSSYESSLEDTHKKVGLDSNHPSNITPIIHDFKLDQTQSLSNQYNTGIRNAYNDFTQLTNWNKLINSQKTLIPQYCKKQKNVKTFFTALEDIDRSNPSIVKQCGSAFNIYWRRKGSSYKAPNGKYYKWTQPTTKFCQYRLDIGSDAFTVCNNKKQQGPFVYDFPDVGYVCMCVNSSSSPREKVYQAGRGYKTMDKEETLGLIQKYKDYEKENAPGFWESVADYLGGCTKDYHCVLDLLSIAALAIPGYGLIVSFGLDAINSVGYGIEFATAETGEDKTAAAMAGILTLGGGFLGGGYKAMKNVKLASKNPKIYSYMSDIVTDVEKQFGKVKSLKSVKEKDILEAIYKNNAKKHGLDAVEEKLAHKLLKTFNKIDPKLIKNYSEALNLVDESVRKKTSYNLLNIFKESSWAKALQRENGDVLVTLRKYMKKPLYKEFLVQMGMFFAVQEALQIPSVQKWIGETYHDGKYALNRGIKNRVEKDGYDWKMTKEIFGAISSDDPNYTDEISREDNLKLEKAWLSGWRPFDKNIKEPTPLDFNVVPEKYRTNKYKERISNSVFDGKNVSLPIEVQKQIKLFNNGDNSNVDDKTKEQQQKKIITKLKSIEYDTNADYENFDLDDF